MALSSHMNIKKLSSKVLPASEAKTTNLDSTQPSVQHLTEVDSTEENLNYNLLVIKVKNLLSKPSNF